MTEEDKINEVLSKYLGSYFSREAEAQVRSIYGDEIAAKVRAVYNDALNCPVDWRTASMDSALALLASYLKSNHPWLTPEAKSALNSCYIMTWK